MRRSSDRYPAAREARTPLESTFARRFQPRVVLRRGSALFLVMCRSYPNRRTSTPPIPRSLESRERCLAFASFGPQSHSHRKKRAGIATALIATQKNKNNLGQLNRTARRMAAHVKNDWPPNHHQDQCQDNQKSSRFHHGFLKCEMFPAPPLSRRSSEMYFRRSR